MDNRAWVMTRRAGMRTDPVGVGTASLPSVTASLAGRGTSRVPVGAATGLHRHLNPREGPMPATRTRRTRRHPVLLLRDAS
jgi:hypothetical protein